MVLKKAPHNKSVVIRIVTDNRGQNKKLNKKLMQSLHTYYSIKKFLLKQWKAVTSLLKISPINVWASKVP